HDQRLQLQPVPRRGPRGLHGVEPVVGREQLLAIAGAAARGGGPADQLHHRPEPRSPAGGA
ncbi:hypothetical protein BN1723_019793, partial [Verticillium longisporum]